MSKKDLDDLLQITIKKDGEYQRQLIECIELKNKEIERLNNILDTLMQDMALLNATGKKEIKPKYVFDRIATLRGVDKE